MNSLKISTLLFFGFMLLVASSCKKGGCTNPNASNYNSKATKDDGSCINSIQPTAIIRVESLCGDQNTLTEHKVTCAVYQLASDYMIANVGNPCTYYTFTDINGNSISGYLRSMVGC